MRTVVPPPGLIVQSTSSIKVRMKKMPRPEVFRMFSCAVGSGTVSGVESCPLVVHADFDSVRRALQTNLDDLLVVLTITMKDCVRYGLAHGHIDAKRSVITDACTANKISNRCGGGSNRI